ncbi:hypothetical protein JFL43_20725 [Viridibacillus sp. YIM B01967]|uniref:Uncharacterized protein n=1 Tax=Viridibacillus soli TaxID=2798301 RepID=A0ABS1HCM6_9BACL|nr:hypothetical protein [Viridibacillus soli]MBK3497206.1 hypothetical protein [Viridibacillus soli]
MKIVNANYIHILIIIIVSLLLVSAILIAVKSYFNNKEIESLSSSCLKNDGEYELVITNKLTQSYKFSCENKN